MNKNILDFYFKVINLKETKRTGWIDLGIDNPESVMDHIGGTMLLAMAINNEKELNLDMNKVYEMIAIKEFKKMVPDNKDFSPVEFLNLLSNSDTLVDSYNEYLEGTSKESKFVSMVSKLESDMQAKVYEKEGLLTEENALEDIKNHPDDISIKTVNKPSDAWLNYNRKFYDELFTSLSLDIEEL